jgi:hypothetical protein
MNNADLTPQQQVELASKLALDLFALAQTAPPIVSLQAIAWLFLASVETAGHEELALLLLIDTAQAIQSRLNTNRDLAPSTTSLH